MRMPEREDDFLTLFHYLGWVSGALTRADLRAELHEFLKTSGDSARHRAFLRMVAGQLLDAVALAERPEEECREKEQ